MNVGFPFASGKPLLSTIVDEAYEVTVASPVGIHGMAAAQVASVIQQRHEVPYRIDVVFHESGADRRCCALRRRRDGGRAVS